MPNPVVAIVGRPNVGKSTLFNRLLSKRVAIVDNVAGVTRDRLYRECEWTGRRFLLIDTGGLQFDKEDNMKKEIALQVTLAIEEAELILFMVDAREGLSSVDIEISHRLRKSLKPVILVINKVEGEVKERESYEFYRLGYEHMINISAEHGLNTGDLLDQIICKLPEETESSYPENTVSVAIVGRPNVGKSSLLNGLLGEKRVIVDSTPGTTRDSIDTLIWRNDNYFNFIDTAGIRRKSRVTDDVEYYSVIRAFKAISRAEICLLVIDAEQGVSEQDKKIAGKIIKEGKSCLVVVNKWDLVMDREKKRSIEREDIKNPKALLKKVKEDIKVKYSKFLRKTLYFVDYSPILFISALNKWGLLEIFSEVIKISNENSKRINTPVLNQVVREAVVDRPLPA
ncbi:MAG TPA: ribosome biogenesis GTPase Der, partial [Candidatus Eremiobacteraeota bacterium]|nr:ribosome biogenesis GTPase Der [Candidatus Eremiobacteraeota bacterium]